MQDRFYFDGHVHFPRKSENIERMLDLAIERGIDAIGFTDYDNTSRFRRFTQNRDLEGETVLSKRRFGIDNVDPSIVRVSNDKGRVYVFKSQEVKTADGHMLAWGAKEDIASGLNYKVSCSEAFLGNGIVVIPHVGVKLASGLKSLEADFLVREYFVGKPIALELNGQIPKNHPTKCFPGLKRYCFMWDIPLVGGSDIHGQYLKEYEKIGLRTHSSIPASFTPEEGFFEVVKYVITKEQGVIQTHGIENTLTETVAWYLESMRQNGLPKIAELGRLFK